MSRFDHRLPDTLIPQGDICVPLHIPNDPHYVRLLVRNLRLLTNDRMYERDDNHNALIVREQWKERMFLPLIEALANATECFDCEAGDCEAYDNSATFITYSPQNPFSEPDVVPSGYLTPPFTLFKDFPLVGWLSQYFPAFTEELTGYQPNDVIVDISSLPSGSWTEPALGMPQIAIDVSGNGIIELHMINFPLGGRAIVTIDSQPNVGDILGGILGNQEFSIELNRDIISIPPETVPVSIFEVEIDEPTPTNHTIYITFVPTVDDSLIPLNFGGGIRKVVLCGLDSQIMPIVEEIRLNNCQLEQKINGQWIAVGDVNACITAITNPMQAIIDDNTSKIATNTTNIATNTTNISANANQIALNLANIAKNAGDITFLQGVVTSLQAQIDDNDTDITFLQGVVTSLQAQIDDNDTDISALQATDTTLLGLINANNALIDINAQRIDILEAQIGQGGGGSTLIKTTPLNVVISANESNSTQIWQDVTSSIFDFLFTYDNAFIVAEFRARTTSSGGNAYYRLAVEGQIDSTIETQSFSTSDKSLQVQDNFNGLAGQQLEIKLQHKAGSSVAVLQTPQIIQYWVLEWQSATLPDWIITWDEGGATYTIVSDTAALSVDINGNPDNCLKFGNFAQGEYAEFQFDTGIDGNIQDFTCDVKGSGTVQLQIWVDGILQGSALIVASASWFTVTWDTNLGNDDFPQNGQVIKFRFTKNSADSADFWIDNVGVIRS